MPVHGVGADRPTLDGGGKDEPQHLSGGAHRSRSGTGGAKVGKVLADVHRLDSTDGPPAEMRQHVHPQHRLVADAGLRP